MGSIAKSSLKNSEENLSKKSEAKEKNNSNHISWHHTEFEEDPH